MDNPTEANLASYAYAQRLAMDMSSRFSSRMTDFMSMETLLDESNRRPTSSFALKEFHKERDVLVKQAMDDVKLKSKGVFFFYASDCGFCHKMVPILNAFSAKHNMEILGISLDGGIIPGMENFNIVEDVSNEVASQFNVNITPTLYLVMPNNEGTLIVEGLKTLTDFEDKLLLAARKSGSLDESLYAKTRNVREINVYKNADGSIIADKEKLDSDPNYLAEMLRIQLADSSTFGTPLKKKAE
jgi:conjugal transfer pilus assembly protein TraF